MNKLFDLTGKKAIITGGNGGIGRAIAAALASAGADIIVAARNRAKTNETVSELQTAFGVQAAGVEFDVLQEFSINQMVLKSLKILGSLDILVNNSGIAEGKRPETVSSAEWDRVIDTNLRGAFLCSKAVYPILKKQRAGKIINIGSMTSIFGSGFLAAYGSSKGGIVQLSKSLAVAWAPDNIQVNAILPGWFKTELGSSARAEDPTHESRIIAATPMGRWGETHELGGAAIFLAGQASNFVTGIAIPVDGGYSSCLNGMDGPFKPAV